MADLTANLKIDTAQFTKGVESAIQDSKQLQDQLQKLSKTGGLDSASKDAKVLDKNLEQASTSAKQLANEASKIGKELDGASKSGSGLSSIFQGIGAGAGIGIATAGIELLTSALTESVVKGKELVEAQRDLQKMTGLTGEAFNVLKKEAQDAFVGGVGESVAEATKIIGNTQRLLGNVLPADQLGEFTAKAQTLGRLYDKDVNEVIAKSTPFIKQFGLDGDRAFNLIALASQKAGTPQDDLLDTIAEYSQLLDEAGFSAEDFAGVLIQAGDDAQFGTDKIADAIKEAQIRLRAGDTAKALAGLSGIPENLRKTLAQAQKDAASGKITVKDFLQITGKDIEEEFKKGNISKDIQTQLQVAIAGTPAEDIGSEFYGKVFGSPIPTSEIEARAKEAGKAFERTVTFDSVIRQITGTIQVLSADLIKIFEPVLGKIVGLFSDGAGATGFVDGIKSIAQVVANVLPSIAAFYKIVFDFSQLATRTLLSALQKIGANFSQVFGSGSNEGATFFETISSVASAFGATIEATVDIVSTYIGLLGTVWGSVFGTILGNYSEGEKGTQSFADKVKSFAETTAVVVKTFADRFNSFMSSIKPVLSDIGAFIGTFAKYIGTILKGAFDLVVGSITATVNVLKFFGSVISDVIGFVVNFTSKLFGATTQTKQTTGAVQQSTGFFGQMGVAIQKAGGILNYFTAILAGVTEVFSNFATGVSEGFKLLSSGEISKGFDSLYNSLANSADAFTKGYNKSIQESQNRTKQLVQETEKTAEEQTKTVETQTKEQNKVIEGGAKTNAKTSKGATKKEETELQKRLKQYKEYTDSLVAFDSEFDVEQRRIKRDLTLTEEDRQKQLLALEKKTNDLRQKELRRLFTIDEQNKINFVPAKDETLKEVKSLLDNVNKETRDIQDKADDARLERGKKFYEKLAKADVEAQKEALKEADTLAGLTVGQQLTTNLIELLGLEGVKVGEKLTTKDFENAQQTALLAFEDILSDVNFALTQDLSPESRKNLEEQRKDIQDKLDKLRLGLDKKETKSQFENALSLFTDGLKDLEFNIDTSEAEKAIKGVQESIRDLDKQLAKGEITGEEYQRRIGELKAQEAEALKSIPNIAQQLLKATIPAFNALNKDATDKLANINEQFRTNKEFVMDWGQVTGLAVQSAIGSFAQYQDATGSTLKAVVLSAIDALNALVPIISAQIFGLYASSPNPANTFSFGAVGAAAATLVTSAFLALVKSAVAGFETGGLVRGGEQLIRINEKGQEFVNNASSTRRNMPILEALNRGNDKRAFELMNERFGMSVSGGSQVVNLQELTAIRTEIQMLRKERVLSRTKIEMNDVNLKANGRDLVGISNAVQSFKNKRR